LDITGSAAPTGVAVSTATETSLTVTWLSSNETTNEFRVYLTEDKNNADGGKSKKKRNLTLTFFAKQITRNQFMNAESDLTKTNHNFVSIISRKSVQFYPKLAASHRLHVRYFDEHICLYARNYCFFQQNKST